VWIFRNRSGSEDETIAGAESRDDLVEVVDREEVAHASEGGDPDQARVCL